MSSRILAVHLTSRRMCIAAAESTLGSIKVTTIVDFPLDKASSMARMISDQNWDRIVASIPAEAAVFRFLEFPFRDKRRLDQAVGPALEEYVPLNLETALCSYDYASPGKQGPVLAAMAERAALERQLTVLAEHEVVPAKLIWAPSAVLAMYRKACGSQGSYTVVDISQDGAVVGVVEDNAVSALRVIRHCPEEMFVRTLVWTVRTISPDQSRLVLGGSMVGTVSAALREALPGRKLESLPTDCPFKLGSAPSSDWRAAAPALGMILGAGDGADQPAIEFTLPRDDASPLAVTNATEARPTAIWAAVAVALALTANGLGYLQVSGEHRALQRRAEAIYEQAMPGPASGRGLTLKMEMRVKELQALAQDSSGGAEGASPLRVLALLSSAIPSDLDVEFDTFVDDPPNIRFTGRGSSFEAVTKLQESLESNDSFASIEVRDVRAAVNGSGVDFQLLMKLKSGEQPA